MPHAICGHAPDLSSSLSSLIHVLCRRYKSNLLTVTQLLHESNSDQDRLKMQLSFLKEQMRETEHAAERSKLGSENIEYELFSSAPFPASQRHRMPDRAQENDACHAFVFARFVLTRAQQAVTRMRRSCAFCFRYLKNVIVKFIETDDLESLLPVISTVLHLSPEEVRRIQQKRGGWGKWASSALWGPT